MVSSLSTATAIQTAILNAANTNGVSAEDLVYLATALERLAGQFGAMDIQSLADTRKADLQTTADAALQELVNSVNSLVSSTQDSITTMVTDAQANLSGLAGAATNVTANQAAFAYFLNS